MMTAMGDGMMLCLTMYDDDCQLCQVSRVRVWVGGCQLGRGSVDGDDGVLR